MTVRVRYAPSPTGEQHIGGVRTALFNYLFARSAGGRFILRVEDTDVERSDPRYERGLYRDLRWLGLLWDEGPDMGGPYGPYRQSERDDLYRAAAGRLLDAGQAYLCYCSPDELRAEREQALAEGRPPRYGGRCRIAEVRDALARQGRAPVVRYAVPRDTTITVNDLVRGEISFSSDDLGDYAIYRAADEQLSHGQALYNLAAVVDDHAMGITHVLRGEEHLPNTPRQMLLYGALGYEALGYEAPAYGHLSLILSPDGAKMSKRLGDTSIDHYRQEGYLPEALLAYIATLGWAPGEDAERLSLDELVDRFDVARLSANPSVYDARRLERTNRKRLQNEEVARLGELLRPRLEAAYGRWENSADTAHSAESWYHILVDAVREEAATLNEMVSISEFALVSRVADRTPEAGNALADEWAPAVMRYCRDMLTDEALRTPLTANEFFRQVRHHFRDSAGIRGRLVMFPLRAALTGTLKGPCLGVVGSLLGAGRCIQRLEDALS
jgi:glutamyl-tRNA synthetase